MLPKTILTLLALTTIAACQSTQDAATNSGFRTSAASGFIESGVELGPSRISRRARDADGDGYAHASGNNANDEGFVAYAGILPTTDVGTAAPTGQATYDASYNLAEVRNISLNGNLLRGTNQTQSGNITLRANFTPGTLTGTSGNLNVNGTFAGGTSLGGSVTWRGTSGPLRGLIGQDEVVGVFHGNDEDLIFAGGFNGNAR